MTCTFCGHSNLFSREVIIRQELQKVVVALVKEQNVDCFLVGNYGKFDFMAAGVCLDARELYPHITVNLVVPYLPLQLDKTTAAWYKNFDDIIYPALASTPAPYRILKANQYMVDKSNLIVSYVISQAGGAAKTLAYAKQRKKTIIQLY